MSSERAGLNLDDDFDISGFQPKDLKNESNSEEKIIKKIAEQSGFSSRKSKNHRRKKPQSPYKNQLNLKCRDGMKDLFHIIGDRLEIHDHTTFENALLALIEKQGYDDLLEEYKKIKEK